MNFKLDSKIILRTTLLILFFEIVSFLAYSATGAMNISFLILLAFFVIITVLDYKLAIFICLVELFIGGKGYLFFFQTPEITVSIRIGFFIVLFSFWLVHSIKNQSFKFSESQFIKPYLALAAACLIGFINALIKGTDFGNIFLDFNAYIFFLYLPVFYELIDRNDWSRLSDIFVSCFIWLGIKTMTVLYFFSHGIEWAVWPVYHWIRNTGAGEITLMSGNIYRTFFQSHIFTLIGLIIFLTLLIVYRHKLSGYERKLLFIFLIIGSAVILISLSRSFWLAGFIASLVILLFSIIKKVTFGKILRRGLLTIFAFIFAFALLFTVINFPVPEPAGNAFGSMFLDRVQVSEEAAASSRWNLLPKLWQGILKNPLIGSGFGAEITYISNDPRIRATSPSGAYTTYAFEWGLLDIFYKIGLIGIAFYLWLIYRLSFSGIRQFIKKNNVISLGLVVGLFALFVANFFTPYLNHPLGIGYLLITSLYLDQNR